MCPSKLRITKVHIVTKLCLLKKTTEHTLYNISSPQYIKSPLK